MAKEQLPTEYNLRRNPKRPKYDNALLGLILGIIFPCIGIYLLYWAMWTDKSFSSYLSMFTNTKSSFDMSEASKVISLAIITNLIPFYFFLNKKAMLTVKGIIIASALALLLVVLYKFIWN